MNGVYWERLLTRVRFQVTRCERKLDACADEDEEAALIAERLSISLAASSYQGDGTSALSQAEM